MEELYKSNSNKGLNSEESEEHKVEKVVKGTVKVQKRSLGRRLYETFFSEDISTIKSYILEDVIVPYVKNILSEAFDTALFGNGGRARSSGLYRNSSNQRTNYSRIYDQKNSIKAAQRNDIYSYDDVILSAYSDAVDVMDTIKDILSEYDMASVGDLKMALGVETTPTDWSWGWDRETFDASARIVKVRDGYLIKLPRVQKIK